MLGEAATAEELAGGAFPRGPATLSEHLPVLQRLVALRHDNVLGDGGLASAVDLLEKLVVDGRGDDGLTAVAGTG